jgi:hypothetical protein
MGGRLGRACEINKSQAVESKENAMNGSKNEIFLFWEKLRIGFNLILLFEAIWFLREYLVSAFASLWDRMALIAIAANVCYFLGPLTEICVRKILGVNVDPTRHRSHLMVLRAFLFSVGLGFSMWLVWDMAHIVVVESSVSYSP